MNKSKFALLIYTAYLEWHAKYGEKEAFTYAMGVAYGMFCAGEKEHFRDVVLGLGGRSHKGRLERLRSFFE